MAVFSAADLWHWALPYGGAAVSLGAAFWAFWTKRSLEKLKAKYAGELAEQQSGYAKELEAQKNSYTAQIETLKNQLTFYSARKSKFADKEFEVLAGCWSKLNKAYNGRFSIQTALRLRDYDWDQADAEKKKMLIEEVNESISVFVSTIEDFETYYSENIIYIKKDIQAKINAIHKWLFMGDKAGAMINEMLEESERVKFFTVDWDKFKAELDKLKTELEQIINKRLFFEK